MRGSFSESLCGKLCKFGLCQALQVYCWAEAPIKIARMTLTIKLDGNWSSFQLANSAPPLSVTDSAIAPSARMEAARIYNRTKKTTKRRHTQSHEWFGPVRSALSCWTQSPTACTSSWEIGHMYTEVLAKRFAVEDKILPLPQRVCHTWRGAMPGQHAWAHEQAQSVTTPKKN